MDNDQRDRRDWPASDAGDEPAAPSDTPESADTSGSSETSGGSEPGLADASSPPAEEPASEPAPEPSWSAEPVASAPDEEAAAEMEAPPQTSSSKEPTEPADAGRSWPTEPPAAGSGGPDVWPTSAPERTDEPAEAEAAPSWPSEDAAAPMPAEPTATEPPPAAAEADWSTSAATAEDAASSEPPPSEVEAYPASEPSGAESAAAAAATAAAQGVPDAEGAVGESTKGPRCGTANRPGLAFCRNCGQRLVAAGVATTVDRPGAPEGTQACPRCGTHNRSGVAFCQNCGANLRGTSAGYVPPAVAGAEEPRAASRERGGAVLGPVVLLIGMLGLATGYLLPFPYGDGSLFDRAFGPGGYGAAFWAGYPEVDASIADQAYFGLAAPVPVLGLVLLLLAGAGILRARGGGLQTLGLVIALAWSVGLAVLFGIVEVGGNVGGDLVSLLRGLTPAGIIFFLASLIVVIGTLTRFGRS